MCPESHNIIDENDDDVIRDLNKMWNPDHDIGNKNRKRYPERGRIISDVIIRSPQPIHGIARATRLTHLFPSKEILFKKKLAEDCELNKIFGHNAVEFHNNGITNHFIDINEIIKVIPPDCYNKYS